MSARPQRYQRAWLLCGIIVLVAALQVLLYPHWYRRTPVELYQQAHTALMRNEKAEPLRLLTQVHRRVPNIELSRFIAGWCQHCLSNYDAAIAEYRLAMHHTPNYAQTYANMGYVLKELGRYDEAADSFARHLQREPSNTLSQAALDECRQRAASTTGATAQILFLSPASNTYFCMGGIDTTLYIALERGGVYRCADSSINGVQWLQRGTWSQDSNGLIHIRSRVLHAKDTVEESVAAVWCYRGHVFSYRRSDLTGLLAERDEIVNRIEEAHNKQLGDYWSGYASTSRLAFEANTGGVNQMLGMLAESGMVPLPFWLLRSLNWLVGALFALLPVVAVWVMWRVRPQTPCPQCGQPLDARALRGYRRPRCKHCKAKTKLALPIPWRVRLAMTIATLVLLLWLLLAITTLSRIPQVLWHMLIIFVWIMSYALRNRLYARWLFARIKPPGTIPNATP